jgi:NAD(P)-dependent dehydrogenase (short-subunit alcohol dehydrogenase family)
MPAIVITGASQGIGRSIAESFSTLADCRLALISRNVSRLLEVANTCRENGAEAETFRCDVTDEKQVKATAKAILEQYGPPDGLVNNAGSFEPGALRDMEVAAFKRQLDSNLTSAFLVTREFLPHMIDQSRGYIFFMGSVASIRAYPGGAAYCAAKHGLLGLARVVREETRELGLRVTTLLPGATWTPSWSGVDLPEDRFIPSGDIGKIIVDLYQLDARTVVEEIVVRPQRGDI